MLFLFCLVPQLMCLKQFLVLPLFKPGPDAQSLCLQASLVLGQNLFQWLAKALIQVLQLQVPLLLHLQMYKLVFLGLSQSLLHPLILELYLLVIQSLNSQVPKLTLRTSQRLVAALPQGLMPVLPG